MNRRFIAVGLAGLMFAALNASPAWLRDVRVSPDGTKIAFRYRGDIYTVDKNGGEATRLTSLPGMEQTPVWSPDGSMIAFASDRDGAMNIYVMDADGGKARRLTSGSVNLTPEAFAPDGSAVIYSGAIQDPVASLLFPSGRLTELYSVPVTGGLSTQILATPAEMVSFMPDGRSFLYHDQKGVENKWRKHHTSSATRDIWLYDADKGTHTNLTAHPGEDRNAVLAPDGRTVYFLSERDGGSMNVHSFSLADPKAVNAVSTFTTHPVRFLSQGADGDLVYAYDGEIYTQHPGAAPRKLDITIKDDSEETPLLLAVTRFDDGTPSPDGSEIALVSRGNILVTSTDYATTRQITDTPGAEKEVSWHPDGRKLVYASDRSGLWDIYESTIDRADEPGFANATLISEKRLFADDGRERNHPAYSPDGSMLAFVQHRDSLMVMDVATGKVRALTDGSSVTSRSGNVDYEWSPDGKWIVTSVVDKKHDPYADVALINVATGETTNLTGSGYFDEMPRWALGGNAIIFMSDRYGMRSHASWGSQYDVMAIFLNQEALDRFNLDEEDLKLLIAAEKEAAKKKDSDKKSGKGKKKKGKDDDDAKAEVEPIKVELDGIRDRMVRLTANSSDLGSFIITGDEGKETLYYLAAFEGGYDLWKRDLRKGDTSIADKLDGGNLALSVDKEGKNLYLIGYRGIRKMSVGDEKMTPVKVEWRMHIDTPAEREAMFDYVVREEAERFYDPAMHGVDWKGLTESYRLFLPHINNNYDFAEMLSELLGELNVSHTGSSYYPSGSREPSAVLGLLYDMSYRGKGRKVAEIVKGSPFRKVASAMRPGFVVEKINGHELNDSTTVEGLLKRAAGRKTLVSFLDPATGKRFEEVVEPISRPAMTSQLYDRWVERNRHLVDSLSGGRLGYVHLRNMSDESFRTIYADLLGRYYDREGVVIDTRWNGGGRLHEDIEVLFSGEKYFTNVVHGKEVGEMPSRRWNKPSIMLICEANYSNAHGTPWVYRHRGLGKLVGAPVPGTMTSVNWVDLQDPSLVFGIPVTGMRLNDGTYLENQQLEPDILVLNDPADIVRGIDAQMETAVSELLKEIDAKKK